MTEPVEGTDSTVEENGSTHSDDATSGKRALSR